MIKVVIQNLVSRDGDIKCRIYDPKKTSRNDFVIGNVSHLLSTSNRIKKIMGYGYDEILEIDSENIPVRKFNAIIVDFSETDSDEFYEKRLKAGLE